MPAPGYLPYKPTTPQDLDALLPRAPSSFAAATDVLLTGGSTGNLTSNIVAAGARGFQAAGEATGLAPAPRMLQPEEANRRFGIEGSLRFDKPVSESEAALKNDQKHNELGKIDALRRSSIPVLGQIGLGFAGGVADPAGLALSLIPVVGGGAILGRLGFAAEGAAAASRGAAATRGLVAGGLGGFQGGVIAEGATYGLAHGVLGKDYSPSDAALGITMSAILGSGFHGVGSAIGWRTPAVRTSPAGDSGDRLYGAIEGRGEHSRQDQVSPKGAFGVAQLLPETAQGVAKRAGVAWDGERARTDADYNRFLGRAYVEELRQQFGDEPVLVSAAYNAGPGRVREWIKRFGDPRAGEISAADFAAKIPFKETRDYVGRVAGDQTVLSAQPGETSPERPGFDPLPAQVRALDEPARTGAFLRAVDDLAQDRPVQVGGLIDHEHALGGGDRPELNDGASDLPPLAARPGRADVAVTVRGSEVPVRYAVAELRDLVTSHDDDLIRNPNFPDALQPRDRERAGSQARLLRMEREFNPRRLMETADAESGAPIVGPDGVVESGNGRTIVLRRNAVRDTPVYQAYRAELERRGYDIAGMKEPVLVRIRSEPTTGAERVRLSREMNADVTERLGDTEQAFEDAATLSPEDMALHAGGEPGAAANRPFVRRFADKAAAGQENAVVDPQSLGLTQAGERRVRAALLAKAYGDKELVYAAHEDADGRMKALAQALTEAAPAWAALRAAAGRGELAPGLDITGHLSSALSLVRHARENRFDLGKLVEDRQGQASLFGGESLSPQTEALLRLFFRDEALKVPRSREIIAQVLNDYAARAVAVEPGPGLFGEAHAVNAPDLFQAVAEKWTTDPDGSLARKAALEPQPPGAGLLRDRGADGEPAFGQGLRTEGGRGAEGQGGGASAAAAGEPEGLTKGRAAAKAALADPELKALAAENAALAEELGEDAAAEAGVGGKPPEVIAEMLRAAAFCLGEGGQ